MEKKRKKKEKPQQPCVVVERGVFCSSFFPPPIDERFFFFSLWVDIMYLGRYAVGPSWAVPPPKKKGSLVRKAYLLTYLPGYVGRWVCNSCSGLCYYYVAGFQYNC